jgi:hypothetical protein
VRCGNPRASEIGALFTPRDAGCPELLKIIDLEEARMTPAECGKKTSVFWQKIKKALAL